MYDIICCIILGFFITVGLSNTVYFLIKEFFKPNNLDTENLTEENAEYILRSSRYYKINYKIHSINKNDDELRFIYNKLYQRGIV